MVMPCVQKILPSEPAGPGLAAASQISGPPVQQMLHPAVNVHAHHRFTRRRVVGDARHPRRVEELLPGASRRCGSLVRGVVAFVVESGQRDLPAVALPSEAKVVRNGRFGDEHLVEGRSAAHLSYGADFDAGMVERKHERRHAAVLDDIGIGARQEQAPVRELGPGAPHFLAVHYPPGAVANGATGEAGQVGPGARLAEQLAAQDLGGQQRSDEPGLLLRGAEVGDSRGD